VGRYPDDFSLKGPCAGLCDASTLGEGRGFKRQVDQKLGNDNFTGHQAASF
jgi:hypothetical protein